MPGTVVGAENRFRASSLRSGEPNFQEAFFDDAAAALGRARRSFTAVVSGEQAGWGRVHSEREECPGWKTAAYRLFSPQSLDKGKTRLSFFARGEGGGKEKRESLKRWGGDGFRSRNP